MFNMTSLKENLAKSSKPNTVKLKWSGKPGKQRSLAQSYSLKKNPFKQKRTHLTREQQHYECALLSDTESKYVWDNFIEKVDMDQNERKAIKLTFEGSLEQTVHQSWLSNSSFTW